MEEKVAIMKLKVDLQCKRCYMKVKRILSKYPQIRDQLYDEKNGIVTIKVVWCCSPEKMRDIICCEGGGSIKSIEIVEPSKPIPLPGKPNKSEKPKPEQKVGPPADTQPHPPKHDVAPAPTVVTPAVMFPEPMPVSVYSYPSPVGLYYGGGPVGPPGYYGKPIYNSYGGSGPFYAGSHHDYMYQEEEASGCTIN